MDGTVRNGEEGGLWPSHLSLSVDEVPSDGPSAQLGYHPRVRNSSPRLKLLVPQLQVA